MSAIPITEGKSTQAKQNYFEVLNSLDVSKHIEKKGSFSYLSWPYAVAELRKRHPTATWEVVRFNGLPFLQTDNGCFVEVAVTVDGIRLSQIHPVLDGRNRPIPIPDAFSINTSLQRALVKAIALHGLGLYIYAGEDVPEHNDTTTEGVSEGLPEGALVDHLSSLSGASDIPELQKAFAAAYTAAQKAHDKPAMRRITEAKDARKKAFAT